jgi:hypothetical protein
VEGSNRKPGQEICPAAPKPGDTIKGTPYSSNKELLTFSDNDHRIPCNVYRKDDHEGLFIYGNARGGS